VLFLWTHSTQTRASIAAASLQLVSTFFLAALSYNEHVRSIRPSLVINVYLLLTVPLCFTEARTLWTRYSAGLASVQTAIASLKLALLVAEAVEKKSLLRPGLADTPAESFAGLYSRSLFWWLNPLFIFGYRGILSDKTLLNIDNALLTKPVYARFERRWRNGMRNISLQTCLTSTRTSG
jgi:ATP-binding cassette, subfamily C (CFTR/MRP), member 1